ncbi:MAG TPA: DMT family transporter [Candidatus Kapabacteria bacterium]|nr:DMT family transporter [Candidatus Kapabacteria bacterium]
MKIEYLLSIVLSAFLHAFYNFLMRKSMGSRTFFTWMFIISTVIALAFTIVSGEYRAIPWRFIPYVYAAAFFYTVYQVFVSHSYQRGNISQYYPLTVLSPIFIPIWASLFLAEKISIVTGLGILVTMAGALLVKLNSFSFKEFKKMFGFSKDYVGARFALGASVVYSFGAVFDKAKIASFPLPAYHVLLLGFIAINGSVYSHFVEKEALVPYFKKNWQVLTLAGFIVFLSFLTFRVALRVVPVSIAVPVRQVAIVFAILLGILSLKEKFRLSCLIGSLIIILGIVLVNLGIR